MVHVLTLCSAGLGSLRAWMDGHLAIEVCRVELGRRGKDAVAGCPLEAATMVVVVAAFSCSFCDFSSVIARWASVTTDSKRLYEYI